MKCERCEKELGVPGTLPTLELKALGLYNTEHMTIGHIETSLGTIGAGTSTGELLSVPIVVPERFMPRQLHRIPGLPYNAYPLINAVSMHVEFTVAVATTAALHLLYRDTADVDTLVQAYQMTPAAGLFSHVMSNLGPFISSSVLGEKPATFGSWVLAGSIIVPGGATATFHIHANFGVLYGAPK